MINDNPTAFDLAHQNTDLQTKSGWKFRFGVPPNRAFSSGELVTKVGAIILFSGKGENKAVFCDVWVLDVERIVNIVEDPQKYNAEDIWKEVPLKNKEKN